jgi:hypothetical protein
MKKIVFILMIIGLLFTLVFAVQASQLAYDLTWWTADGGGGFSQGEGYTLSATIGQVDAGTLQGGSYSLAGGFWSAAPSAPIEINYWIVLPLVIK